MVARINGIDGLRAIAMTLVIAQHCKLFPVGWMGVWLFYLISGYVITNGFIKEELVFSGFPKLNRLIAFLKRRFIRIVPAYYAYVLLTIIFFGLLNGFKYQNALIGLLTFTNNWQMLLSPLITFNEWRAVGHLWTISVEQQFYLFFPVLFLWVNSKWRWRVIVATVLLGPFVRYIYDINFVIPILNSGKLESALAVYASSICHFDAFLIGAILAKYQKNLLSYKSWLPMTSLLSSIVFMGIYFITFYKFNLLDGAVGIDRYKNIFSGILYGNGRQYWVFSVVDLFAFSVMLLVLSEVRCLRFLSHPFISYVGRISYGGYLIHALSITTFSLIVNKGFADMQIPERVGGFIIVWLLSVFIAALSFKYFETPIAKKYKTWSSIKNNP